jgi:hypothetical protein
MSQTLSQLFSLPAAETLWQFGRIFAIAAGFIVLAWAIAQWRRAALLDSQRMFEQLDLLRSELFAVKEALQHAQRQPALTTQSSVTARSEMPPAAMPAPASAINRGYEVAARMARSGASKDDLVQRCGVTPNEAELLLKLHTKSAHTNSAKATQPSNPQTVATRMAIPAIPAKESAPRNVQGPKTIAQNAVSGTDTTEPAAKRKVASRLVAVG